MRRQPLIWFIEGEYSELDEVAPAAAVRYGRRTRTLAWDQTLSHNNTCYDTIVLIKWLFLKTLSKGYRWLFTAWTLILSFYLFLTYFRTVRPCHANHKLFVKVWNVFNNNDKCTALHDKRSPSFVRQTRKKILLVTLMLPIKCNVTTKCGLIVNNNGFRINTDDMDTRRNF